MIGLDTNVLVRYVMQDDPRQSPRATRLVESLTAERPGFVSVVALTELVWVLSGSYGLGRAQVVTVLDLLLRSKELVIDQAAAVAQTVRRFADDGADFADALIERLGAAAGCEATMSFDLGALKAAGMRPVP
ncbi:MAG TPA: type II toxin-antitoxin system VapC family toxin [Rubrivivax sp.]|nr:type II toxin-antitoxin system VapC family toxin [Burkholderiales bacterium]HNU11236.1 type II toxin-antitoxin system VapC family toxin [Rubrivivax sp.]